MAKPAHLQAHATILRMLDSCDAPETGTRLATIDYSFSCHLASGTGGHGNSWGGARNRADRVSDGLRDSDVKDMLAAAQFALAMGRTFQRHWTIHYGKAGIADKDATGFIGKVLDQVGKQAARKDGELTALWVRECASGKGGHVHILMHLPVGMKMQNRTIRWIENAGGTYAPTVSKVKIVGGRLARSDNAMADAIIAEHYRTNAMFVTRYLLKACGIEIGEQLELTRLGQGGRIIGKRRGWTQNIGNAARNGALK